MPDLRERFEALDALDVPDVLSRARMIGPRPPDPDPVPSRRRIGALVFAAVVAIAAVFLIARSLEQRPRPAVRPPPPPVVSGTLGALAYAFDGDIWVADWDGGNPVRIADGGPPDGGDGCGPAGYGAEGTIWSPDGRYLAYRYDGCDGDPTVIISDPQGNVVTSFPGEGWLVSWSPDSSRVAVWVKLAETIGIYGLDGVRQTLLILPPGLMAPGDFDPVWSPDGESLVVPHGVEIPLDGSTPQAPPSGDVRGEWGAAYSPDGSRIAYIRDRALVLAAADGSEARELIPARVEYTLPIWSPTGDRIVFSYQILTGQHATELRMIEVATGAVMPLAGIDGRAALTAYEFSPEGDKILFLREEPGRSYRPSIWSVETDGSLEQPLVIGASAADWRLLADEGP